MPLFNLSEKYGELSCEFIRNSLSEDDKNIYSHQSAA